MSEGLQGHKWVAILDDPIEEIDVHGRRLRIPKALGVGDVVFIRLNSASADPRGNPRKELRIYTLPPNPNKTPPRFHLGGECRGYEVFHFADFGLYLYEASKPIPFLKLRQLLEADEIDVVEVFNEFDRQIFRIKQKPDWDLHPDADALYDKAMKCKARLISTKYEAEADVCYRKAVRFLGQVIGLEIDNEGKPLPIFYQT